MIYERLLRRLIEGVAMKYAEKRARTKGTFGINRKLYLREFIFLWQDEKLLDFF